MNPLATCDDTYTEKEYIDYVSRRSNARGLGAGLTALGALFALIGIMMTLDGYLKPLEALGVFALTVLLLALGLYCLTTGKVLNIGTRNGQIADFMQAHGSKDGRGFRERVLVGEDGIAVQFGPAGCTDGELRRVEKPWSAWRKVKADGDYLLVVCKTPGDGAVHKAIGYNALIDELERDGYEDALLPVAHLEGMGADELKAYIRDRAGR